MGRISTLILRLTVVLPSEGRAQKRKRFPGAGRGLEQRVAVALSLGAIQGRYDPAHERELRPVRPVRELHLDASDVVRIFGGFRVRV